MFSMGAVRIFEQLARVQGQLASAAMTLPDSVQKMFKKGGDDTIRFTEGQLEKSRALLNLCESNGDNRIRGCGYDGSIRFF
jgi:hypothetical protein